MRYHSTRDESCKATDVAAIIDGLAPDGGLYVPEVIPQIDWQQLVQLSSVEISAKLLQIFFPSLPQLPELVRRAYAGKFASDTLTPTVPVGDFYLLELFHGPTAAFKDIALSVLPHLLVVAKKVAGDQRETLVLTATSGDTGKAAMEGFADVAGTQICVFYPDGGVSQIQRAQMVTQSGANVRVYGIRGNFDDAQTGVKQIFAKVRAAERESAQSISSANSINIGRLIPQIMYYFAAYRDLLRAKKISCGQLVDFAVPTGNFGDILAGYFAKRLGLPVGKLICAANANNVLSDFFQTGIYDRRRELQKTISPSMDILVSSNLERMLYFLTTDAQQVAQWMGQLAQTGYYQLSSQQRADLAAHFWAGYCDDVAARQTIRTVWEESRYLCDPHTAAAWKVAQDYQREFGADNPLVVLVTASPYKFPHAVLEAVGEVPAGDDFALLAQLQQFSGKAVPQNLASLQERQELHSAVIDVSEMMQVAFGVQADLPERHQGEQQEQKDA